MKITLKNITFYGFKSKSRTAHVSLCDDVSIIYADNGVGKTSFLNALHYFFTQQESELVRLDISKITCTYVEDEKEKVITVNYDQKKLSFDWKDFEKSALARSTSTYIAIERAVNHRNFSDLSPSDILEYMVSSNYLTQYSTPSKRIIANDMYSFLLKQKEKNEKENSFLEYKKTYAHDFIKNNNIYNLEVLLKEEYKKYLLKSSILFNRILFESLSSILSKNSKDNVKYSDVLEIVKNKNRIIRIVKSESNDDKNIIDPELDIRKDIINILSNEDKIAIDQVSESILKPLFYNIYLKIADIEATSNINSLISIFNSYLDKDKELIVNKDKVYIKVKNQTECTHDLDDLSSGERHILTLLTTVLLKSENKNFLFIDEPEISLNVRWQINLIDSLKKLIPHTQIIVASHSPYIAGKKYSKNLCELMLK